MMPSTVEQNLSTTETGNQSPSSPSLTMGAKKVLVIDDTADIRMIIAESLNIYGFTTLTAEDGMSGIQMAKEQLPDLIICDINMPNLDGYATLTALRENDATVSLKLDRNCRWIFAACSTYAKSPAAAWGWHQLWESQSRHYGDEHVVGVSRGRPGIFAAGAAGVGVPGTGSFTAGNPERHGDSQSGAVCGSESPTGVG